jgi:signal transduction histidine kinase
VKLRYGADELMVEVRNEARRPRSRPFVEGNGIIGMRERVLGLGGDFVAGPDDRGFAVRARFPLEDWP